MIQEISIKNFQSHSDSRLAFSRGVNIIVGESDSGKSAILKSLYWVVDGRPLGDGFRSDWGGDTEVSIKVDGNWVGRKKTKNENIYFLNKMIFKAFKTNVPDEISKAVNINSKINIQKQMDSPFLVSQSSGEVARQLNELVDLQVIDSSLSYVEKKKRKLKVDQHYLAAEKDKIMDSLSKLDDLDDWENQVGLLNQEWEKTIKKENQFEFFKDSINDVSEKKEQRKKIQKVSQYKKKLDWLYKEAQLYLEERLTLQKMKKEIKEISDLKSRHKINIKEISKNKKELKEICPEICPLCGSEWSKK